MRADCHAATRAACHTRWPTHNHHSDDQHTSSRQDADCQMRRPPRPPLAREWARPEAVTPHTQ